MMTQLSRNTNYIVLIRSYSGASKIVVLGCGELEILLRVIGAKEDVFGSAVEGTLVFSAGLGLRDIAVREYQGGEASRRNFGLSPSVGYDAPVMKIA